jgi:hypothetical protein
MAAAQGHAPGGVPWTFTPARPHIAPQSLAALAAAATHSHMPSTSPRHSAAPKRQRTPSANRKVRCPAGLTRALPCLPALPALHPTLNGTCKVPLRRKTARCRCARLTSTALSAFACPANQSRRLVETHVPHTHASAHAHAFGADAGRVGRAGGWHGCCD